jgi:hypothetical protein
MAFLEAYGDVEGQPERTASTGIISRMEYRRELKGSLLRIFLGVILNRSRALAETTGRKHRVESGL